MINQTFFKNNRKKVFNRLTDNALALFHANFEAFKSADSVYPFHVNRNFFYLTGINQPDSTLIIGKIKGEYHEWLFIDRIDPLVTKWIGKKLSNEEASELSGIDVKSIMEKEQFVNFMQNNLQALRYSPCMIETVYLDLEQRSLPLYNTFGLEFAKKLQKDYPAIQIKNSYTELVQLRMIKEEAEVYAITSSIETTKEAIENVLKNHKEIKTEADADAYFTFVLNRTHKKTSFGSIMASGGNATTLHYEENDKEIKKDSLILMDVGCFTDNYASDITRTIPLTGRFTPRQKEIYEIVLEANKKCIEFVHAGLTWGELNDYAKNILTEGCKKIGLIKEDSEISRYYYHSVSHSLGMDAHDPTLHWQGIKEGMVITIEPGLYIAEEGIGIRIEDDVLVLENGSKNLSISIPKEVEDIENLLK